MHDDQMGRLIFQCLSNRLLQLRWNIRVSQGFSEGPIEARWTYTLQSIRDKVGTIALYLLAIKLHVRAVFCREQAILIGRVLRFRDVKQD